MAVVHVLGANFREANAYGAEHGVETVFVTTPAQLRMATKIVVLPSFGKRRDGMILQAALRSVERYARNGLKVEHPDWVWDEPKPPAVAAEESKTDFEAISALHLIADRFGLSFEEAMRRLGGDESNQPSIEEVEKGLGLTPEAKPEGPKVDEESVTVFGGPPRPKSKRGPANKTQPKRDGVKPPVVNHPDF